MEEDLLRNIDFLKKMAVSYDSFQDDILIFEFDRSQNGAVGQVLFPAPARREALTLIGVMSGELSITIDYISYRIPAHGIVWIMPTHIMQVTEVTPDTRMWILQLGKSFMENSARRTTDDVPIISYMQLKKYPYSVFEPEEFESLYEDLQMLRNKFNTRAHLFHEEMVKIYLKVFVLDMADFFFKTRENFFTPQLTRKEELFADFLSLLAAHCKDHHMVSFYADKLCITPQYLSLILKEQSGRSASRWIQDALIVEAKRMLKMPRTTVQEVADNLHFPDQSTFGKFFKMHTGMSPLAFRRL
ncbi:MAG: helix-turn-helix transcriptional regulator [Tannerella sp.]|jgi:AraC-like DNA-binding protein|nr:helix-turn-helix transcriptional regulator [Tannerella sp.]